MTSNILVKHTFSDQGKLIIILMATKICVPCDFGIENMYDPFHGNVNIEFADETKIKVNSLILSWNSATFCYFFNELRLENVEIKDFTKEAVILYLESLYSGDLKLEKGLFRELYKLSVVFKTKWLSERCTEYFYQLCESISNEFEDLCFVFSEALYANNTLKNGDLMDMVVGRFSIIENIASIFVERYLKETFSSTSSVTLDNLLLISSEDYFPVLRSLKEHLVNGEIDDTTRSLLTNPKIVGCLADNVDVYEEMYEVLVIKSDNMNQDELKMLINFNFSVFRATRSPSRTLSKQVVPVKDIPNLFHDFKVFNKLSDEEILQKLSCVPNISIFMVVELCYLDEFESVRDKVLQNITQIFASKSLCRVPSRFIQSFQKPDVLTNLPQSVISDDDTSVIVGTKTLFSKLVTTSKLYKFYFQHPAAPQCEKHTECGFMLKVTPCSKEEAGKFNIQLVTEESEYPAGIHCHSEVISAAHMHLVMEVKYSDNRWYTDYHCISWKGRPEYSAERGVECDGVVLRNVNVRLVVYYDIRDIK